MFYDNKPPIADKSTAGINHPTGGRGAYLIAVRTADADTLFPARRTVEVA